MFDVLNAKAENMPKDNIAAAIKRSEGKDAIDITEITYDGKPLSMAEPRRMIGYLPENFKPNPNLTVEEYVLFQDRLAVRIIQRQVGKWHRHAGSAAISQAQ